MRKTFTLFALACILTGCVRDKIEYPVSDYYLSIGENIPENTRNKVLSVNFYAPDSGTLSSSPFFVQPYHHPEGLPSGGYINGIVPGRYTMLLYGYDTKTTRVFNKENISKIYADTETVGYSNKVPVIRMPDHLLRYCADVNIPYLTQGDERPYIVKFSPVSVIEEYPLRLGGIRNYRIAADINIYVSGQCPGRMLGGDMEKFEGNAIIGFAEKPRKMTKADSEEFTHVTNFTTFGRNLEENRVLLTVVITAEGGISTWAQVDITEEFEAVHDGKKDAIEVDLDLDVEARKQGGFNPTTQLWEGETEHFDL